MPVTAPVLSPDRRQPPERVATHREQGALTMVAQGNNQFVQVKPVAWVRPRGEDDNHWTNKPIPPLSSAASSSAAAATAASSSPTSAYSSGAHPALIAFQQDQARALEQQHARAAANLEGRTSSSVYGAHTQARPLSEGGAAGADARINAVGAEQIREQQSRLWAPLSATSKRLGFGISNAPAGSELAEIEKEQDKRRFLSTHAVSFMRAGKDVQPVIEVPESMNRTTSLFPLSPVNQPKPEPKSAAAKRSAAAAEHALRATAAPLSPQRPPVVSASASLSAGLEETSTAHSLGYGHRHQFARHYLSSAPQI